MQEMVSIIVPAHNEETAVANVIDEIRSALRDSRYEYEIIVVDDGSTDGTYDIALTKKVTVCRHAKKCGSGAARKTGLRQARGGLIVMLDCDASYPAKDIPRLLDCLPEYDQVIGTRNKEHGNARGLRLFVKGCVNGIASLLTGTRIPDINSGFRAFKKKPALEYINLVPDGFSCVSTLTLIFLCTRANVKFIPIDYRKRVGRSKFKPLPDTLRLIFAVLKTIAYFRFHPRLKKNPSA